MRFPDPVVIVHPNDVDEYGNPAHSFDTPQRTNAAGFLVTEELILLPASAVVTEGDRLEARGRTFEALDVDEVRSPAKTVLWTVKLRRILG